jgi:hypothetical protein
MVKSLLAWIVLLSLPAATLAQGQGPSNFRKTSIATGGSIALDFSYVWEQALSNDTLDAPLGAVPVGTTVTNLDLKTTAVLARFAAGAADENTGVEVFFLIGTVKPEITGTTAGSAFTADGNWGIGLGGGGRYRFFRAHGFSLFVDGWVRWSRSNADISLDGVVTESRDTDVLAWEGSLYLSYEFDLGGNVIIAPYGGLALNGVNTDVRDLLVTNQEDMFGVLVGVEGGITENISLYAEGRFLSQTSIAAGVTIAF